jgi:hypothetical protein
LRHHQIREGGPPRTIFRCTRPTRPALQIPAIAVISNHCYSNELPKLRPLPPLCLSTPGASSWRGRRPLGCGDRGDATSSGPTPGGRCMDDSSSASQACSARSSSAWGDPRGAGGPITVSDDRTQARPKRHASAALMHRGGPGVSARFAHRKPPPICAQNNGIPLGSCADSFIASHGIATSRRPTRDPAGSQAPVVAHTNVLELESRPKSYSG